MGEECLTGEEGLEIDEIFEIVHWSCPNFSLSPGDEGNLREIAHKHGSGAAAIPSLLEIIRKTDEGDAERARDRFVDKGWIIED